MDAWQKSYTTNAKTGVTDFWNGRFILEWRPTDRLKASFTLNRWVDHSDTLAQQLIAVVPTTPFPVPELANYPLAPHNDRAADFDPGRNYRKDNNFLQGNARLDYQLGDTTTLTSLTSYSLYHENQLDDLDGTTVSNNYYYTLGRLRSVSEELRLSGSIANRGHFTFGANYADDSTHEFNRALSPVSSVSNLFSFLFGTPLPVTFNVTTNQDSITKAVFANFDYNLTDALNVYAGARYTNFRTDFNGCASDSGDNVAATIFTVLDGTTILPGECFTLTAGGTPGIVHSRLHQNNVSWRAGAQWTLAPPVMIYANVSKGFKAGSFPILPANDYHQFAPVTQESVVAYEAGFKAGLFNHALQLNGAVFHYDYSNKQLLGSANLPGVGVVLRLVNIPKSRVNGAEFQLIALPIDGLRISASGTYIDSKITSSFVNPDPFGQTIDFKGEHFPNTPKWQLSSDAEYKWRASDRLNAFVGGNLYYQSRANSAFGDLPLFNTKAYTLLDLRAGVEAADGRWRATIWGRNVTNAYYWSSVTHVQDTVVRYPGMPVTYGVSLSFRYR
jgi:outer membrane receptor protein involved in Fe transport